MLGVIDNKASASELSDKLSVPVDVLERFLGLLSQTEIVRFDNQFSQPQKPRQSQSLNFWIHTTNRCNLGCSYCYISTLNSTGGMTSETREQLLQKLVQTVTNKKISHVKLRLAGGEPLSQFKAWQTFIPQAKHALSALGCQLEFSFLTNLTILTDQIIEFSKEHGISYGVSLDGLATDHDATRRFKSGAGSFRIVDANLRQLISHKIPVSTNTVITNANLNGLPDLTRCLIGLDIRSATRL